MICKHKVFALTFFLGITSILSCRSEKNELKDPVATETNSNNNEDFTTEIEMPQQLSLTETQSQAQDQGQVQTQEQQTQAQTQAAASGITGTCIETRTGTSNDSYLLKFDLAQPAQPSPKFIAQAVIKISINCAKAQIKMSKLDPNQAYQLFLQILVQSKNDGKIGPVLYHGMSEAFKASGQGVTIMMKEGGLCTSKVNIPDGPLYMITFTDIDGKTRTARLSQPCKGEEVVYCTQEYAPVCGLPPQEQTQQGQVGMSVPKTYSNRCMLNGAKATFLFEGECDSQNYSCTKENIPVCGQIKEKCAYPADCTKLVNQTFTNICELNKAKATPLYDGACKTN